MKPEIERAIRETLEAWDMPDSPEAMAAAVYQLRRVYREAMASKRPKKKISEKLSL